jgi:hypothetical protein
VIVRDVAWRGAKRRGSRHAARIDEPGGGCGLLSVAVDENWAAASLTFVAV